MTSPTVTLLAGQPLNPTVPQFSGTTILDLEELVEEVEPLCPRCGQTNEEHSHGRCPVDPVNDRSYL